jgi:hypothetical protein
VPVESASWTAARELDNWVRDRGEWWGTVRSADGHHIWIKADDLRRSKTATNSRMRGGERSKDTPCCQARGRILI